MRKPGRKTYGYKAKEREIIERIVRKRRTRKGGLVVSYCQIGRRACVKELKPHRMRHTYSTNFLNSGGGIENLQSQLGHEHLSTTQIYAKSLEKAIRPAINRLQQYHDRL